MISSGLLPRQESGLSSVRIGARGRIGSDTTERESRESSANEFFRSTSNASQTNSAYSRSSTGESVLDAIQDPDSLVFDAAESRIRRLGFFGYLVLCLLVTLSGSVAGIGLWSDMGCGHRCLAFLQARARIAPYFAGGLLLILLALYLLDFFCPPHMPGFYCTFSENGNSLARCCLAVAALAFIAMVYLLAEVLPTAPLVLTIFLCPVCVMLLRQITMPRQRFTLKKPQQAAPQSPRQGVGSRGRRGFELRMEMLKMVTGEEKDQKSFYLAATYAFGAACAISLLTWVPWVVRGANGFDRQINEVSSREERELLFVRWASPLIIAVSNLIFATFTGLRVVLNRAYTATDEVRNRLIIGGRKSCMNQEMMDHRIGILRERLEHGNQRPEDVVRETRDKMQQYLVQHISHMRQLSNIVKVMGCAFVALIGALYIAFQLTAADSQIALTVQGILGAFFLTFMLVICVSFSRLWQAMSIWLKDLPLWKSAASLCCRPWAIAFVICLACPFAPIVLGLSFVNQWVRRCRRLTKKNQCLTERVHEMIDVVHEWNWVAVVYYCYIMATVVMVYKVVPVMLNVLLAYMSWAMQDLSFLLIILATFGSGMILFMLPPVPGPPIYLFGGVVLSEKCPWGFWAGSGICIALCFVLKLTACAVQQKLFGEQLGNLRSVRRAVGVHKPLIRAIEHVLRTPGLSFGKCMILCGGPDWPTSVLAGILKIPLWRCLLGTVPVILNVLPMTLTGSFYLKRDQSKVWIRAGNLMFSLTALVTVVFWAGMAWAIQDVFDREHESLSRPIEEHIDLDWLDYREKCLSARCALHWNDLPTVLQAVYVSGAGSLIGVGLLFFWRSPLCFGSFKLTDDVTELRWLGNDGLVRPAGAVGLVVAAVSHMGLIAYLCWAGVRSRAQRAKVAAEVDASELAWKEERRQAARSRAVPQTPRSLTNSGAPQEADVEAQNKEDQLGCRAVETSQFSGPLAPIQECTSPSGSPHPDPSAVTLEMPDGKPVEDQDPEGGQRQTSTPSHQKLITQCWCMPWCGRDGTGVSSEASHAPDGQV